MTEQTSNQSDDEDRSEKRLVVANGIDLDKRYFYEITKAISRDRDLRKLSLFGPPIWALVALVGFFLAATAALQGLRSIITAIFAVVNWTEVSLWAIITLLGATVIGITVLFVFRVYVTDFVELEKIKRRFWALFNVFNRDVWQNLNYWHPFTSHLSDRDPIVPLSSGVDAPVSSIYSDGPHYQNVFVDALYIRPRGDQSWTQRIAYTLYKWDRVRRHLRRSLYVVAGLATLVAVLQVAGLIGTPTLGPILSAVLGIVVLLALVVLVLTVVAGNYLYFHLQFFSDSAGLSRYEQLLNPEDESILSRGEKIGLANSMNGYGIFYVSRFVASLFGRQRYDVSLDPEALAPGAPEWEAVIIRDDTIEVIFHMPVKVTSNEYELNDGSGKEHGSKAFTIMRDGEKLLVDRITNAGSGRVRLSFDGRVAFDELDTIKLTYDGDSGTVTSQEEIRARSFEFTLNADGTNVATVDMEGEEDAIIVVERENKPNDRTTFPATGFDSSPSDEHATAAAAEILWASLPADAVRDPPDNPDLTLALTGVDYYTIRQRGDRDRLVKETAGEREGYRLPVKKFMSVRHGFDTEALRVPENPEKLLYSGSWREQELHTLYVGGGEHQQAINKLLLVLKSEGYQNIDIRENAFAVGPTSKAVDQLRRRIRSDDEDMDTDEDKQVTLPIEYFVSLVSGGNDFFRQDTNRHGHGFLLFRHELDREADQREYVHILIGMSAVGTKIGALFWQYLVTNEFRFSVTPGESDAGTEQPDGTLPSLEEDVLYFFDAPGPTSHPICEAGTNNYDDIGDLYTDTAWSVEELKFDISPLEYETVERSAMDANNKRLGTKYFELKINDI